MIYEKNLTKENIVVSIIIPAYNEKNTILNILDLIKKNPLKKEIIVVDDCSKDGTTDILKNIKDNEIKVFFHEKNQGKGAALKTGLKFATGDIIIIQDADMEYNPLEYEKLIEPILNNKAEVVYGSRYLDGTNNVFLSKYYVGVKLLNYLVKLLYGTNITDEATCYKVFKSDVLKKINLKCKRFEFCPEVTAKVLKQKYKIIEVPIKFWPRSVEEGKKIKIKDGIIAIWTLIKYRFVN